MKAHEGSRSAPTTNEELQIGGTTVTFTVDDLESRDQSPRPRARRSESRSARKGYGSLIAKLIYNTVTTLYVGEKIMIQMPTWFFPAGAGAYSEGGKFATHGEPSPMATFRFAEPIYIDKQQNFRVEIEVPDSDVLKEIQGSTDRCSCGSCSTATWCATCTKAQSPRQSSIGCLKAYGHGRGNESRFSVRIAPATAGRA